jgi:hypothetical protein
MPTFITIHDLSREFNVPARVIRYRFLQAVADGRLKEGDDFRRDDYKDDQHFVWKVNPLSFSRVTELKPTGASPLRSVPPAENPGLITNSLTNPPPAVNNASQSVNQPVTKAAATVNTPPPAANAERGGAAQPAFDLPFELEVIGILREQLKAKDEQIRAKDDHIKNQDKQMGEVNELNVKLTGTMLQQSQKIERLLRLGSGGFDSDSGDNESVTKPVNQPGEFDNNAVNNDRKPESTPASGMAA